MTAIEALGINTHAPVDWEMTRDIQDKSDALPGESAARRHMREDVTMFSLGSQVV